MSYSGTVRCRYCRGRGHNITTCPELKDDYKVSKAKYEAGEDTNYRDAYIVSTYERVMSRKKRKKTHRKCSYCRKRNHNRTTCQQRKDDIDLLYKAQDIANRRFRDAVMATGVYHGAMLECKGWPNIKKGERTLFMFALTNNVIPVLNMDYRPSGKDEVKERTIDYYRSDAFKRLEQMAYINECLFTRVDRFFGSNKMYNKYGYSDEQINLSIGQLEIWNSRHPLMEADRDHSNKEYIIHKSKDLQPDKVLSSLQEKYSGLTVADAKNKYAVSEYKSYVGHNFENRGHAYYVTRSVYSSNDKRSDNYMQALKLYVEAFTEKK